MNDENPLSSLSAPQSLGRGSMAFGPSLSPTMRELECAIADIGRPDLPVLLVGEQGTGKEVVAREIHRRHGGAESAFLKVRCADRDSRLLREFFRETARTARHGPGLTATVFLDEIADLDAPCQGVVAEAIADGDGIGHTERLISASCQNLEEEIREQRFREDLFYRLNGVCLRVPPLRHRKEDIPALMEFFLRREAQALGRVPVALQPETLDVLLRYSWPGNVRELEEVIKRILLSGESVALAGLPSDTGLSSGAGKASPVLSLKEAARNASRQVERELILKTLARTRWNRKRAARELGISYKALLYKLKQIVFDDPTGI